MKGTFRDALICARAYMCDSAGKTSASNARELGLIPGLRRSPREGKGYPLQYSGLENFINYIVHGVSKSQTQLSHSHSYVQDTTLVYTFSPCILTGCTCGL